MRQNVISVFLGAGFSILGGVPLASQLFDEEPRVGTVSRAKLVERVRDGWKRWHARTQGGPEEYLTHLEALGGQQWRDAVWYVALVVTLGMRGVRVSGQRPTLTHHSIGLANNIPEQEEFWRVLFSKTSNVCVMTTNYDVLAERGLRLTPKPRLHRPGFHYGDGPEELTGGSHPGIFHSPPPAAEGTVPILKLHGSVSWSIGRNGIERYHDCRPAIRGNPAIIAPACEKKIPSLFQDIWDKAAATLAASNVWIIVGYSFPKYDEAINALFRSNALHQPKVHVLNPDASAARRLSGILPGVDVHPHAGLPEALYDLPEILSSV